MFRLVLIVLLSFVPVAPGQTADEKKATVAYVLSLQDKGGAFRLDARTPSPSLRATASALRALKYFGGTLPNKVGCKLYVSLCKDKSGGYGNFPGGKPDPVLTAVGLMAAVEVGLLTNPSAKAGPSIAYLEENARTFEEIRLAAAGLESVGAASKKNKEWLDGLLARQNKDGTFGSGKGQARDTGGGVACVLRLGGAVKDADAVAKALDAGQREDGGFGHADKDGSDLETTYRVLRTYRMLKKQPAKADAVRAFIASCRNKDGGYAALPGGASSVGGTYFAGIVLHWLDVK